jgi:AcrR family transcriptional regulator
MKDIFRRNPLQGRSVKTIDTFFKATLQVLEHEGDNGLSTKKVAARSGFSVGSFYQYFNNKEDLVSAMATRGQQLVINRLEEYFSKIENDPHLKMQTAEQIIRGGIRIFVQGFAQGKASMAGKSFNQTLIRLAWKWEHQEKTIVVAEIVAKRLAVFFERIQHADIARPSHSILFVLTRSVLGTVRSASLERSSILNSYDLENALVQMAEGLLVRSVPDLSKKTR